MTGMVSKEEQHAWPRHERSVIDVPVSPEVLFRFLDDHRNLANHMSRPSWMLVGSKMEIKMDARQGREVGSKIELIGKILGVPLYVAEIVTEHDSPYCKTWETIGTPRLLVVGAYRMGFVVVPSVGGALLQVFIDYALPSSGPGRSLPVLGRWYARWCTRKMTADAAAHFRGGN